MGYKPNILERIEYVDEVYDFGLRLQDARKAAKLTQKTVAERLGVTVGVIGRYESNTISPSIGKLKKMAVMYRVSIDYLCNLHMRSRIYIDDMPAPYRQVVLDLIDSMKRNLGGFR